ncbi:MAG: DUF84 family protein [bacterium]
MRIVIGSQRPPKVAAVKTAVARVVEHLGTEPGAVQYLTRDVASRISRMPLSISELMQGAYNRAQALIDEFSRSASQPDFYVGLEGGFFRQSDPLEQLQYFLQGWVYVSNGERGYFGASEAMPVPEKIVAEVVTKKQELGEVIDGFGGERGIRNKYGAFGVFSQGLLTRQASFEIALVCAFAPFFKHSLFRL